MTTPKTATMVLADYIESGSYVSLDDIGTSNIALIVAALRSHGDCGVQTAREAALERAARDFVNKVDRGEARSSKSYAAFKAALSLPEKAEGHPECPCKPGKCIYPKCTCPLPSTLHRGDAEPSSAPSSQEPR